MTPPLAPRPLLDLSRDELAAWAEAAGERAFRADQIRRWVFGKRVASFEEMHDVPKALRERLAAEFRLFTGEVVGHQIAKDRTEKLLLRLGDGSHVECVLMRETGRRTVCVSSQVGCAMGCVFCASGLLGVKRNLTTAEILEQVLRVDRLLDPEERLTNVVVMGIGEPLANLRNMLPAIDTLNDKGGLGLGARRITISTVGLPEKIRELAAHGKPYNLAVSLHAPNDALRTQLVPVNKSIGIAAILEAADEYFERTGRRVTYEYVLLGGVNDAPEHAGELGRLLAPRVAHVNLIPMNAVTELPFAEPAAPRTAEFVETLSRFGVVATVRKRKGADIDAACGQLRLKQERAELVAP
ncbi:MAG TPA: 23S rRNA (adenine(2503)-C(2))-methyltransferase RlmN [Planctomycetaceae bacterium]